MDYFYVKKRNREVTKYFDPATLKAWGAYNEEAFKPGKLDVKTKELIAVACTYIPIHTQQPEWFRATFPKTMTIPADGKVKI